MDALKQAISVMGGVNNLARAMNVGQSVVSNWLLRSQVPANRAIEIERATAGKVTRHQLRPDLYPVDDRATA